MTEVRTKSSTGGEKGVKLARFDLVPVAPLTELAEHYGVGASKYANHQWRQGYEWSKSYSALMRHLTAFWAGLDYDVCSNDPKGCSHVDLEGKPFVALREDACFNHTGSHHMAAVAWHAFLLLEFKDAHQGHDDRYKAPVSNTLEERADELIELAQGGMLSTEEHISSYVGRWVSDYDIEHPNVRDFPRIKVPGLTPLAEAAKFGEFDAGLDVRMFQDAINTMVRRQVLAEAQAEEDHLRGLWGPDLLSKHPTRWDRG